MGSAMEWEWGCLMGGPMDCLGRVQYMEASEVVLRAIMVAFLVVAVGGDQRAYTASHSGRQLGIAHRERSVLHLKNANSLPISHLPKATATAGMTPVGIQTAPTMVTAALLANYTVDLDRGLGL